MVNVFLIIIAVVIPALVVLASLYLIAYFQHPDDKNVAYFPKIIVVSFFFFFHFYFKFKIKISEKYLITFYFL